MTHERELQLGILGLSEGNGHPYSWSAIINGYDPAVMAECPFPVIPQYLARQVFPRDSIQGARVTHIWTQDDESARHVARATHIPQVVSDPEAMLGEIDAVLLARDDAENHLKMARPFLLAGLPIYIDKPVALTMDDLESMLALQQKPGQLFSCSALRWAREFNVALHCQEIGPIRHIQATTPKGWSKYAVHVLDPILEQLGLFDAPAEVVRVSDIPEVVLVRWKDCTATITCTGALPSDIRMQVFGNGGSRELVFVDTFAAFREALLRFVAAAQGTASGTAPNELRALVRILEMGLAR